MMDHFNNNIFDSCGSDVFNQVASVSEKRKKICTDLGMCICCSEQQDAIYREILFQIVREALEFLNDREKGVHGD